MSSQKTEDVKIALRHANTLYQASRRIQDGTFRGRWHFSFDMYNSPRYNNFGNLRVLNDDTLSPGAVWPLHPHTQNEVVTYVAEGEFRHEDERSKGGVLHKGGVQHTTVGRGMYHSEINNRKDIPMRFIQIWYMPERLKDRLSGQRRLWIIPLRIGRWTRPRRRPASTRIQRSRNTRNRKHNNHSRRRRRIAATRSQPEQRLADSLGIHRSL